MDNYITQIQGALIAVQNSEVSNRVKDTLWATENDLIIVKMVALKEEWNKIKKPGYGLSQECIIEVDAIIERIYSRWTDLDKYRHETISHPYGAGYNGKEGSIFKTGLPIYDFPNNMQDTMRLILMMLEIVPAIAKYYPEEFRKFKSENFPYSNNPQEPSL